MGWNSWNKFACNVSEDLIKSVADAMATNGMKDAGYQYVVIDDCWQVGRDENGFIVADPQHFPSGIKALADYVHSKGLKFGHLLGCGREDVRGAVGQPGARVSGRAAVCALGRGLSEIRLVQHRHAQCGGSVFDDEQCAAGDRQADRVQHVRMGHGEAVAVGQRGIGNLWRTTGDISDVWSSKKKWPDGSCCQLWHGGHCGFAGWDSNPLPARDTGTIRTCWKSAMAG